MDSSTTLAELTQRYEVALRNEAAALVDLSEFVFNKPERHDRKHSSGPFQRWSSWRERSRELALEIDRLRRNAAS